MKNIRVSDDAYDWWNKIRNQYFSSDTEYLIRLLNMTEHYNVKFYRSAEIRGEKKK